MEGETTRRLRPVNGDERQQERPAIWVCSVADYHEGLLYGGWVDAAQDPEPLAEAIAILLNGSRSADATEWAILQQRGFYGLRLRHNEDVRTISRLGAGVLRHGEAFAHWALFAGFESYELLDAFVHRYLGHFPSTDMYVRHVVAETERYRDPKTLPPSLRAAARFAIERLACQWAEQVHVAEATEGGVYLFDPQ